MSTGNVAKFFMGCTVALFFTLHGVQANDVPQFPQSETLPGAVVMVQPEDSPIGPLPPVVIPASNPQTQAKVELGKKLYFDPRLSGNNWISCATCHNPALGFADGLPRMLGGPASREGGRNTPTIINTAYNPIQFWDGRAATLEEQALGPIQNPNEMNETLDNVIKKLSRMPDYVKAFKDVFGSGVTADGIAKAIAAFERTIVFANSPFDKYMMGDEHAMSEAAKRGMILFNTKAECIKCHNGPNFTDNEFHNIAVPADGPLKEDLGRYNVTKQDADKGAFKTPTLRNITDTAPYMHDGFFPTLFEVVQFYNGGGGRSENKSPDVRALHLTGEEVNDLIEFLKALTGELVQVKYEAAPLVYPELPREF